MNLVHRIEEAEARIRPHVRETPLEASRALSPEGGEAFLKLENFQRTGSFKLRGALNKLEALDDSTRSRGVVAASSGNHGAGVACGAAALGTTAVVYVPQNALTSKVRAIRELGAEVRYHGDDCIEAEAEARAFAAREGATYISPYNDFDVVAGQGSIGVEIARQEDTLDAAYIALGGGGLLSGVGTYLRHAFEGIEIIACSPRNSCVMHQSLDAGRVLDLPSEPTLSDGTAGGVESDSLTFELCRDAVTRKVLVDEDEIRDSMRLILERHHMLVEGAAGVAVAGFLQERERMRGKNVMILLCGANIDMDTLKRIL